MPATRYTATVGGCLCSHGSSVVGAGQWPVLWLDGPKQVVRVGHLMVQAGCALGDGDDEAAVKEQLQHRGRVMLLVGG